MLQPFVLRTLTSSRRWAEVCCYTFSDGQVDSAGPEGCVCDLMARLAKALALAPRRNLGGARCPLELSFCWKLVSLVTLVSFVLLKIVFEVSLLLGHRWYWFRLVLFHVAAPSIVPNGHTWLGGEGLLCLC